MRGDAGKVRPPMALTVGDIMDRDPVTVGPDDDVETVVRLLRRHELPGVPVVNDGGRCIGIVTEADLVIGDEEGDLHLPHYVELFGGVVFLEPLRRFESRLKKAAASRVKDLMTPDPTTIETGAGVPEAGRIIVQSGHNRLPVTDHGRLVGVVTRVDVLEALTREA
jgi:CBS domain-containing protein